MKSFESILKASAFLLCISLTLPAPTLAMRVESAPQSTGAEELTHSLAGAEERLAPVRDAMKAAGIQVPLLPDPAVTQDPALWKQAVRHIPQMLQKNPRAVDSLIKKVLPVRVGWGLQLQFSPQDNALKLIPVTVGPVLSDSDFNSAIKLQILRERVLESGKTEAVPGEPVSLLINSEGFFYQYPGSPKKFPLTEDYPFKTELREFLQDRDLELLVMIHPKDEAEWSLLDWLLNPRILRENIPAEIDKDFSVPMPMRGPEDSLLGPFHGYISAIREDPATGQTVPSRFIIHPARRTSPREHGPLAMSKADALLAFYRFGSFRTGHFGWRRPKAVKLFDKWFGEGNWAERYLVGKEVLSWQEAVAYYEEAYFQYFLGHPEELAPLLEMASDVYDTAPSNVASGTDYAKQETKARHLQDIAIRRVVERLGKKFKGDTLVEIRGPKSKGFRWNPGNVPFHRPELILQPPLKGWWKPGTVEEFWQSSRVIIPVIKQPGLLEALCSNLAIFLSEEPLPMENLSPPFWLLPRSTFPDPESIDPMFFVMDALIEALLRAAPTLPQKFLPTGELDRLKNFYALLSSEDMRWTSSHRQHLPLLFDTLRNKKAVPIFLARDALAMYEFGAYVAAFQGKGMEGHLLYQPGSPSASLSTRFSDPVMERVLFQTSKIQKDIRDELEAEGFLTKEILEGKRRDSRIYQELQRRFLEKTEALLEEDPVFKGYAERLYSQVKEMKIPPDRAVAVVDTNATGKTALFVKTVIEILSRAEKQPRSAEVLLGWAREKEWGIPELQDFSARLLLDEPFRDLHWPFFYAGNDPKTGKPLFTVRASLSRLLFFMLQSMLLQSAAARYATGAEEVHAVDMIRDADLQAIGAVYQINSKPAISEIEAILNTRKREYGIHGWIWRGKPTLFVGVGADRILASDSLLLKIIRRHQLPAKPLLMIHNHNQEMHYPSPDDFQVTLRRQRRFGNGGRDFLYGPRTRRLIEYGIDRTQRRTSPKEIRLRVWGKNERLLDEHLFNGTAGVDLSRSRHAVSTSSAWLERFQKAVRRRDVIKAELDDAFGRWVRWDPTITLASILEEAGLARPAAGAEEADWSDIRWFWELEPGHREELLRAIAELAEAEPDQLLGFKPQTAPWAEPFRQGVEAILAMPESAPRRAGRLMAYLRFLSVADTRQPYLPDYQTSLRQLSAALATQMSQAWESPETRRILGILFKTQALPAAELGAHWDDLLDFDTARTLLHASDVMKSFFSDLSQETLFMERLARFILANPIASSAVHKLLSSSTQWVHLEKNPSETIRGWLAEGKISDLDAFFIVLDVALSGTDGEAQSRRLAQLQPAVGQKILKLAQLPLYLRLQTEPEELQMFFSAFLSQKPADPGKENPFPGALLRALSDENPDLIENFAKQLNDPVILEEALPALRGVLKLSQPLPRGVTVRLLDRMKDPRAKELLLTYRDSNSTTQLEVFRALKHWGSPRALEAVWQAMRDPVPEIRAEAIRAVVETGDPRALPDLINIARQELNLQAHAAAIAGVASLHPVLKGFEPAFVQTALAFSAGKDWVNDYPSRDELERFRSKVLQLPPSGGKIPVSNSGSLIFIYQSGLSETLFPTLTMEEQIRPILRAQQLGLLGKEYVHQLTVQGRLPDEFKHVVVALILSSPYRQDWRQPFFDATWGKVAPMVHDGGGYDAWVNPLWSAVEGRTDFIQRVAMVYDFATQKELALMEQDRLLLEGRAYQRLALALHAAQRTAPAAAIPEELRQKLAQHWQDFAAGMRRLLSQFTLEEQTPDGPVQELSLKGTLEVRWFLDNPRQVQDWERPRYEADWLPVQRELLKINRFAEKDPAFFDALRLQVVSLLKRTTDDIDRDLGLTLPLYSAAGMEERTVVIGPSAFRQVPGLRRAVEVLKQAGLEERLILLPKGDLPSEELRTRLVDAAARAYGARSLIGYAAKSDPVMAGFEELLKPGKVSLVRREPMELKSFVLQILDDVGISAAGSEEAAEEILAAAGVGQAA